MSWEMPQIIFPKQELAQSQKQLSTKTKQNKKPKNPSYEWEPAYTKSITYKWCNKCAHSAKINNKLENISRDQENIKCYMEDLKGGQPNETAREKKRIEMKKIMKNLSIRLYTAEETMSEAEDRSEAIQQWTETNDWNLKEE